MNEKGLYQLSSVIKVFIVSYLVLTCAGLLVSLFVVLKSPIMTSVSPEAKQYEAYQATGENIKDQYMQEEQEAMKIAKSAAFYENLKKAHVHHLGHTFMVFSIAGIFAFTRGKNNIKIQTIVWTTIATLIHTLAFLIYSKILLIIFGSIYAGLIVYMMIIILIDCYKPNTIN